MEYRLDFERQQELESIGLSWGAVRFKRRLRSAVEDRDATRMGAARKLLLDAINSVEENTELWLKSQQYVLDEDGEPVLKEDGSPRGRRGRKHSALRWIEQAGADVCSYIACRVVLGAVGSRLVLNKAARKIATMVFDEIRAERFHEHAPGLFEYKMDEFQTTSRAHMARSLKAVAGKAVCEECYKSGEEDCPHLDMSDLDQATFSDRLHLGLKLIDLVMKSLPEGWLEKKTERVLEGSGWKSETYLTFTPEAMRKISDRNDLISELTPVNLPMVVPPAQWAPGQPGGYRFGLYGKHPFVRASRKQRKLVAQAEIPKVYEAVNRMQETPWRINLPVLDVLRAVADRGGDRAGLPRLEPYPKPIRPHILDRDREDNPEAHDAALREYKKKVEEWHTAESNRRSESKSYINLMSVVEEMENEPAFWFPWNLDFRGRAYPIPNFLQPQGDDAARGLLEFSDGEPVGQDGIRWLAIHGANVLGEYEGRKVSRMTLDERISLIERLTDRLLEIAEDPMSHQWWMEAEKPWQFLAFIFEWQGVQEEGEDYVSHLPVHVDGSCNGLQHFAALLRDEKGAKAVNVTANERPHDVYHQVTESVLDRLEKEAATGEELARHWLASGTVDRKLCKRPTMTFGYGSERYGFAAQIAEHLSKDVEDWPEIRDKYFSEVNPETGEIVPQVKYHCTYLAEIIWRSIQEIVEGAFEAKEWMQESAGEVARSGQPVQWWVPETEFPVTQDRLDYWKTDKKRIETFLAGQVYRPVYRNRTRKLNVYKQKNAIAPNFVHSLDAAVMMLTVNMASHDGVQHFSMIHDSFGTLPSQAGILAEDIRLAFFKFYEDHDPIDSLYFQLLDEVDHPEDFPEPPAPGELDISEVLASEYFFA